MIASFLEDFGPATLPHTTAEPDEGAQEEQRLAVFEQGYAAGWDDAIHAQGENAHAASDAFLNAVQDLTFTYHEACAAMATSLTPFLEALADQVVPATLDVSLRQFILDHLSQEADPEKQTQILVTCAPDRKPLLSRSMPIDGAAPVRLVGDPNLDRDVVRVTISGQETQIDLQHLTHSITDKIAAFTLEQQKGRMNG